MSSKRAFRDRLLNPSARVRAAVALTLSVLIHLLVLGGLNIRLPDIATHEKLMEVKLAPAIKKQAAASLPKPVPVKQAEPIKPKPVPPPEPEPVAAPEPEIAETSVSPEPPEPVVAAEPVPPLAEEPQQTEQKSSLENAREESGESATAGIIEGVEAYIEMEFDVTRGNKGKAGQAHISYKQHADGSYTLVSKTEATGLLSLFYSGELIQKSEGVVTEAGLRPSKFLYEMTSKEDKNRQASFDWNARKIELQTSKRTTTANLPEGAQDLLSFMYQFIFVPPLERMELPITNGKKMAVYTYAFEGEEELITEMGNIRTMHIARAGKDDEKIDLWLAVDYRYMPVKIRKTEEDGSVIEQTITKLATDILK